MGNTVGSQKILNSRQEAVLFGTMLGDGIFERNGKFVRLRVYHGQKQKAYVQWKYNIFSNFAISEVRCSPIKEHWNTKKVYYYCKFDTISNKVFDRFYEIFYVSGVKKIPENINEFLKEPLSLAVWFMDDGYKRNDCNALRISTDSFSFNEHVLLRNCLENNFGIKSKIHKKGKYWNIYIPEPKARKFCEIVKPFIIPEMKYKISLTP